MNEPDFSIVGGIFFSVIIFIVCRFIVLWYFKINDRVKQMEQIIKLLTEQSNDLRDLKSKMYPVEKTDSLPY